MPATATWRRWSFNAVWSSSAQSCSYSINLHGSSPLRELEPVHKVTRSRSRCIMFGAVQLRAVRAALHELFVHSERIRAATQGVYILNWCHIFMLFWYQLKYNQYVTKLFVKQHVIRICRDNHFNELSGFNDMECCGAVLKWMIKLLPKRNNEQPLKRLTVRRTVNTNLSPME